MQNEHLTPEQQEKLTTFVSVYPMDESRALQFLRMCDFDIEQALNTCIETGGNIAPDQVNPQAAARRQPANFAQYEEEPYDDHHEYQPNPNPHAALQQNLREQLMRHFTEPSPNLEFTEEETQYFNYKSEKEKGTGFFSSVGSAFGGIKGMLWGSSGSGEDFCKHASKSIGEKVLQINFSKNNIDKDVSALTIQAGQPFMLYIHDMNHRLAKRALKEVLQNREIACFINANFVVAGILADSKELPKYIPRTFADPKEAPCLVVGKLGRDGKLMRLTVIELNNEGLLDLGSMKVLLKESVDLFKNQLTQDTRFIDAYENKVKMRRLIQSGARVNHGQGVQMNPRNMEPLFQAMMDAQNQHDPVHNEYQKQEEIMKKQQLERERNLRKEQDKKFEDMRKAEEDRIRKEKEEKDRIQREKDELDRKIEEIKSSKLRKMSDLPAEPDANTPNTIQLAFRIPNGGRLTRRFLKNEKVQKAYDFIYTQKNIGLENELSEIEIMMGYPPKALDHHEYTLQDLFGDSTQELLLIKEKS